jgi:hypothetical protein
MWLSGQELRMNVLFQEYFKSSLETTNALSTLVSTAHTSFNIKKMYTLSAHYIYKFSVVKKTRPTVLLQLFKA